MARRAFYTLTKNKDVHPRAATAISEIIQVLCDQGLLSDEQLDELLLRVAGY